MRAVIFDHIFLSRIFVLCRKNFTAQSKKKISPTKNKTKDFFFCSCTTSFFSTNCLGLASPTMSGVANSTLFDSSRASSTTPLLYISKLPCALTTYSKQLQQQTGRRTHSKSFEVKIESLRNTNFLTLEQVSEPFPTDDKIGLLHQKEIRERSYYFDEHIVSCGDYIRKSGFSHGTIVHIKNASAPADDGLQLKVWCIGQAIPGFDVQKMFNTKRVTRKHVFLFVDPSLTAEQVRDSVERNKQLSYKENKSITKDPSKWFYYVRLLDGSFEQITQQQLLTFIPQYIHKNKLPHDNSLLQEVEPGLSIYLPYFPPTIFLDKILNYEKKMQRQTKHTNTLFNFDRFLTEPNFSMHGDNNTQTSKSKTSVSSTKK